MHESDIMHANGEYWVGQLADAYVVYRNGPTHAASDSAFHKNANGLSIAIARCDYMARSATPQNGSARRAVTG